MENISLCVMDRITVQASAPIINLNPLNSALHWLAPTVAATVAQKLANSFIKNAYRPAKFIHSFKSLSFIL